MFLLSTYQQYGERSVMAAGAEVSESEIHCDVLAVDSDIPLELCKLQDMADDGGFYTVLWPSKYRNLLEPQIFYGVDLQRHRPKER